MKIEEDYVKLESHQCPVCGEIHNRDCGILMDKRGKAIKGNGPNGEAITGMSLCEEHYKLFLQGYVALIVIEDENTEKRTGEIVHIRFELFQDIFTELDIKENPQVGMISENIYNKLVEMSTKH